MDKFQYIRILSDTMMPYTEKNMPVTWLFQQDNDSNNYVLNNSVTVPDWPSYSPDFNPIENLWQSKIN